MGADEKVVDNKDPNKFYTDLTYLAENNLLLPFYGRDKIISEVIDVLNRKVKGNVILLGEPGVGKTAIVEGLAVRIVNGKVPLSLIGKRIYSLNIVELLSGSRYRGDFEERLNSVLKKIMSSGSGILFIDEIHTIVNTGGNFSLDIANILKPVLSRHDFKCIGATTNAEYYKAFVSADNALSRRFKNVNVPEMSDSETYMLLKTIKSTFESTHNVHFSDKFIKLAISLAKNFILNKKFPDKVIDVIDNSGALMSRNDTPKSLNSIFSRISELRLRKFELINAYDYQKAIKVRDEIRSLLKTVKTNVISENIDTFRIVNLNSLVLTISRISEVNESIIAYFLMQVCGSNVDNSLKKYVVSKNSNENIEKCVNILLKNFYFYDIDKSPVGRFLYLRTKYNDTKKFCEMLANTLYKNSENYLYIDIVNFVSFDIDSENSYLHDFMNILANRIEKHYNLVVLLDNFEKASYNILKFINKVFSVGYFQDCNNRVLSCKNVVFILSVNVSSANEKKIGFFRNDNFISSLEFIFNDSKSNSVFLKIANSCERILPENNLNNIVKSELVKEIDRLVKITGDYGLNVDISNNFSELFYSFCIKNGILNSDKINDFVNKYIVDKLFSAIKKNTSSNRNILYSMRIEKDNIFVVVKDR